jgi:hypothetical protein
LINGPEIWDSLSIAQQLVATDRNGQLEIEPDLVPEGYHLM